jgi:hypothetical protein
VLVVIMRSMDKCANYHKAGLRPTGCTGYTPAAVRLWPVGNVARLEVPLAATLPVHHFTQQQAGRPGPNAEHSHQRCTSGGQHSIMCR